MYQEIDGLMNEGGDIERVKAVKPMIGKHTRLITCLANWSQQDPTAIGFFQSRPRRHSTVAS